MFDRETGQQLSTRTRSRLTDFVSTTSLSEVVDEVPAEVLAAFERARRLTPGWRDEDCLTILAP